MNDTLAADACWEHPDLDASRVCHFEWRYLTENKAGLERMGGALRRRSRSWPHGHSRCRGGVAGDMRRECGEGRQKRNLRSPPTSSVPRRIPPWRCATPRIEALGHGPRQGGRWYAAVGHREDSVGWGRGKGLRSARAMCQALFTLGRFLPSSLSALLFLDHRSSFSTYILYSTHLIYSYAAQRSEVRTSAPTLDCFLPSSLSARPLVPRSSFSSRPDLCFSAGSGLPWRCGSIPPGLTIRFRSTIIHNRVRVVVQGGLPPSHLNLCGGLRSGTERTICNNTRLTDIDTSVTEILDLYARPRARKSSSFMPAISACRRECG